MSKYNYKVIFRDRNLEAEYATKEEGEWIKKARENNEAGTFNLGENEYEVSAVKAVIFLAEPISGGRLRMCENEHCHRDSRTHYDNERCDYDVTGKCLECGKDIIEKDREFSQHKFKGEYCLEHTPSQYWNAISRNK